MHRTVGAPLTSGGKTIMADEMDTVGVSPEDAKPLLEKAKTFLQQAEITMNLDPEVPAEVVASPIGLAAINAANAVLAHRLGRIVESPDPPDPSTLFAEALVRPTGWVAYDDVEDDLLAVRFEYELINHFLKQPTRRSLASAALAVDRLINHVGLLIGHTTTHGYEPRPVTYGVLVDRARSAVGDTGRMMAYAPHPSALDVVVPSGYGSDPEQVPAFTAWSEARVYFLTAYDGLIGMASAPREPQLGGEPAVGR